jgi:hypothetical protein
MKTKSSLKALGAFLVTSCLAAVSYGKTWSYAGDLEIRDYQEVVQLQDTKCDVVINDRSQSVTISTKFGELVIYPDRGSDKPAQPLYSWIIEGKQNMDVQTSNKNPDPFVWINSRRWAFHYQSNQNGEPVSLSVWQSKVDFTSINNKFDSDQSDHVWTCSNLLVVRVGLLSLDVDTSKGLIAQGLLLQQIHAIDRRRHPIQNKGPKV